MLKKLLVFSGARYFDRLVIKTPFNSNPLLNKKVKSSIERKAERLYVSIRDSKAYSPINKITQFFAFNFVIKPFVLRKGDKYSGVLKHWGNRGIKYSK